MLDRLTQNSHRIGAVFYVLWGILHFYAAYLSYRTGLSEATGYAQAKLFQNAWNLAYLSAFCIFVAAALNWRNSLSGYWLNLITVSAVDVGFILLIYLPSHSTDLIGPVLWLLGLAFTTIGIVSNRRGARML
jgi:hypothetical protein